MQRIDCDVLVVGGGAAGSRAALEAARSGQGASVLLAVDGPFGTGGSSNFIASEALGINAPFNFEKDGDTVDIYADDTIKTGGGLADPAMSRILAPESLDRVRELIDWGVRFETHDGHPRQQKLSGCTKARSLTAGGETGREMVRVLREQADRNNVRVLENVKIVKLHRTADGAVRGAFGILDGTPVFIAAGATVLATGGASSMFSVNVTPPTQTGDGWAMAYEAGCKFVNMEFFQCGPAVVLEGLKFIIHSHMWRFIPKMTNRLGEEFLARYCAGGTTPAEALDLKAMSYPFSVRTDAKYVDISIFKEIAEGRGTPAGGIVMDVTHISRDELLEKAPITYNTLLKHGLDLATTPFEMTIAVQNFNGGVLIDENGFTGIDGLYAAGEISGGVHGSDRPGGNNLTDTQVFGYRAGKAAAVAAKSVTPAADQPDMDISKLAASEEEKAVIRQSERLYYQNLTVIRSRAGVEKVLAFIAEHEKTAVSAELRNRLLVGKLFATAILTREESRGTHYREDYPDTNPAWVKRIVLDKDGVYVP